MLARIIDLVRRALGTKQIFERLDRIEHALNAGDTPQSMQTDTLVRDPDSVTKGVRLAITTSDPSSYFKCEFNGEIVWVPTDTLRTMIHCLSASDDHIVLWVETAHINWMIDRLSEGNDNGLFVDVGAATGAATIPIALRFKQNVSIVAFEPAANAMRLLSATIEKNNIPTPTLVNAAVSDVIGEVTFVEYDHDPTGNCPYLPEASTISYHGVQTANSNSTTVKSITLDNYFLSEGTITASKFNVVVVKIDVEGFVEQVLKGAFAFIEEIRPYFSIDIHNRIEGKGTTEQVCRELLAQFEYKFEKMGHVLLASPK